MRKQVFTILLCLMVLFNIIAYATPTITVSIEGQNVAFTEAKPFVDENGRTLVPLRKISEELGFDVKWDAATKKIALVADVKQNPGKEWFDYNYTFVGELFQNFKNHKADVETFSQIYYVGEKTVGIEYSGKGKSEIITGEIDTCPVVKNGYTYIPARSLVEMIGYEVGWDGTTKHISITNVK